MKLKCPFHFPRIYIRPTRLIVESIIDKLIAVHYNIEKKKQQNQGEKKYVLLCGGEDRKSLAHFQKRIIY